LSQYAVRRAGRCLFLRAFAIASAPRSEGGAWKPAYFYLCGRDVPTTRSFRFATKAFHPFASALLLVCHCMLRPTVVGRIQRGENDFRWSVAKAMLSAH
jgi:hypothetical protein